MLSYGNNHFVENHFVKNNKDDKQISGGVLFKKVSMEFLPIASKPQGQ
jgi:hypothetical protein